MEYHLDGFIINPYVLPLQMVIGDPVLKNCKIYAQDADFGNTARRFLKGDEGVLCDAKRVLSRTSGDNRCNTITEISGFTLLDLVSYERKHNEENGENNRDGSDYNLSWNCGAEGPSTKKEVVKLRRNQLRNAMALLLLAQGTPCILAGDEFLNSQNGNNNAYCQDNVIGWTDWGRSAKNEEMIRYVQQLIAFRKRHPALHSSRELTGQDPKRTGMPDLSFHGEDAWQLREDPSVRQFGMLLGGAYMDDEDIYLVFNMHWNEHKFALPALKKGKCWYRQFTTEKGFLEEPECIAEQKTVPVEERTIEIFVAGEVVWDNSDV
jgi:glycogen operon protein